MLKIFKIYKDINKNRGFSFIFHHILFVFIFATLYWYSDIFMFNNKEFAKKVGLGRIKQKDSFASYLYFSVITQTTIGFGGVMPDGGNVVSTKSVLIKIISFAQMFSIFIISGLALNIKN